MKIVKNEYVNRKYNEFYEKTNRLPEFFHPYACSEIKNESCTFGTNCGSVGGLSNITRICIRKKREGEDTDMVYNYNNEEYVCGIRKLTPCECWRLMNIAGKDDENFKAAAQVNSNTQLYKQAGNSIVKSVLCALMSQLEIKGIKPWNEMSDEEIYTMILNDKIES